MRREDLLIVGRLGEHGRAPYQFRSGQDPSYFLKLLTNRGERILWGKDLERAVARSATSPKIGDLIGARRIGREPVTVTDRQHDASGHVLSQSSHQAYRIQWVVEKITFFAERARLARQVRDFHTDARRAVRNRPELASTFLSLRGAQDIAERRIADPQDRARFLAVVREAMAGSIRRGEPLPVIRIRERRKFTAPERPSPRARRRADEPTR
jgi:hypothetical protein